MTTPDWLTTCEIPAQELTPGQRETVRKLPGWLTNCEIPDLTPGQREQMVVAAFGFADRAIVGGVAAEKVFPVFKYIEGLFASGPLPARKRVRRPAGYTRPYIYLAYIGEENWTKVERRDVKRCRRLGETNKYGPVRGYLSRLCKEDERSLRIMIDRIIDLREPVYVAAHNALNLGRRYAGYSSNPSVVRLVRWYRRCKWDRDIEKLRLHRAIRAARDAGDEQISSQLQQQLLSILEPAQSPAKGFPARF